MESHIQIQQVRSTAIFSPPATGGVSSLRPTPVVKSCGNMHTDVTAETYRATSGYRPVSDRIPQMEAVRIDRTLNRPKLAPSIWFGTLSMAVSMMFFFLGLVARPVQLGSHWTTPATSPDIVHTYIGTIAMIHIAQIAINIASRRFGRFSRTFSAIKIVHSAALIPATWLLVVGRHTTCSGAWDTSSYLICVQLVVGLGDTIRHVLASFQKGFCLSEGKMAEVKTSNSNLSSSVRGRHVETLLFQRQKASHIRNQGITKIYGMPMSFWIARSFAIFSIVMLAVTPSKSTPFNDNGEIHWPYVSSRVTIHLPIILNAISTRQRHRSQTVILLARVMILIYLTKAVVDYRHSPSQESAATTIEWAPLALALHFPYPPWRFRRLVLFWCVSLSILTVTIYQANYALQDLKSQPYLRKILDDPISKTTYLYHNW
ncbi:hypothetical protein P154DRAFT_624933 [Amniculicola lignicola CBS 123094]|uniref:Uncharacterized protein n=1 Tax=Amniculicola lignicola CBS 123094 TaxID=1392246 RepID=A0A6A5VYX8_9PLEO|nr:hypothetical protein P154DRAFT_624933 [Amniculicola lignicola CBS 123094]